MKLYIVYFEIFGKKMKTTIEASSEKDAREKIANKIIFHKFEQKLTDSQKQAVDEIFEDSGKIFKASNKMFDKVNNLFKKIF